MYAVCKLVFRQRIGKPNLLFYHCIIHQQALCAKGGCGLQETMQTVVEIVNLIRASALNHRRFQNHLATIDAEYGNVLFYKCSLAEPWSSSGEICCTASLHHQFWRFVALLPHIISSGEICCTASSHHQFWRDLLHCFLTSSVLERFVALLPHIISSLEEIGRPVAKLDTQFQIRLCVLADIFGNLNKLNMLLQGWQKL